MFRLNGDEIESSVEARPRDRAGRGGRVRLLRIWLWRRFGLDPLPRKAHASRSGAFGA